MVDRPLVRGASVVLGLLAALVAARLGAEATAPGERATAPPTRGGAAGGRAPERVLGAGPGGVAYVDEAVCADCHADVTGTWAPSHHARAMQVATPETVLGDFGGVVHTQDGERFRFFRRDGGFFVRAAGPDGAPRDHPVLYTFGVEPLQQYLVPGEGGRLQALGVAWDTGAGRWFDVDPAESPAPGDPFHWTGRYFSWNRMCADCHATNLRKGYDPETDTYATTWTAPNVGCQACHGPGGDHVAWARSGEAETPVGAGRRGSGLVPTHAMATAGEQVETCARCHARRASITGDVPLYGSLLDDYVPEVLEPGLYHPDGQILDEVYVYGSFVQSRMHAAGVRCSDCHDPHGLGLRAEGNALCTRCHENAAAGEWPGLAVGEYDAPSHHHHAPGSPGAQCVACHMPARTYMVVDPRRDHGLRVPRPDLSVSLGVPNACGDCHAAAEGEDAAWAAAQVARWFGPERTRGGDFAAAIHDGRLGDPSALPALRTLATDPATPAIVRATAVTLLPGQGPGALEPVVAALADADPSVRLRAVAALSSLPPAPRVEWLAPLLDDPVRGVRAEAARALADVPDAALPAARRPARARALAEYERGQRAAADLPTGRLNLALLATAQGRTAEAIRQYRAAIGQDPAFVPPVANLAQLLSALGRVEEAEEVLRAGLSRRPEAGELDYSLGLLLAETGRLEEAVPALERAAARLPDRPRVTYNLGLALQHLGRLDAAVTALERAARRAPDDPAFARALAIAYLRAERFDEASEAAGRWAALAPGDRDALTVRAQAERGRAAADAPAR